MAVLEDQPGLQVTINAGGQTLKEYPNHDDQGDAGEDGEYQESKTTSYYVESVTDQEFLISFIIGERFKFDCAALSLKLYVDGVAILNRLVTKSNHTAAGSFHGTFEGLYSNEHDPEHCTLQRFKFAPIALTCADEELSRIKEDAKIIAKTGEIMVIVHRRGEPQLIPTPEFNTEFAGIDKEVHEKAIKGQAKSHGTSLGAALPSDPNTYCHSPLLDGELDPIAIFKFAYRSREALKSLLIIERTPELEVVGEESNVQATATATQTLNSDDATAPGTPSAPSRSSTNSLASLTPPATPSSVTSASTEDSDNGSTIKDEESKEGVLEGSTSLEGPAIKREGGESEPSRRTRKRRKFMGKVTIDLTEIDDEEERMRKAIVLDDD